MNPGLLLSVLAAAVQGLPIERQEQRSPRIGADHAVPVSIEFGADGRSVFSIRTDGIAQRWSLETGDLLASFGSPALRFRTAAVSPDGETFASGDEEGVLRLWAAGELVPTRILQAHRSAVSRIVWSPDSRKVVTFGVQREMSLWSATTGKSIARFSSLDESGVRACAAFSSDSRRLAFAVGEDVVRVCDAETGKLVHAWNGNDGGVSGLEFAPDGKFLAALTSGWSGDEGRCRIFDLECGELTATLGNESEFEESGYDRIVWVRFSEDGSEAMTMDVEGRVDVRSVSDSSLRASFHLLGGIPSSQGACDYHPGTDLLLPASTGPLVSVFRARGGQEIGSLFCDAPAAVRIHPTGRWIFAVSGHVLRVFDARTLELRLTRIEYEGGNWLCLTSDLRFSGTPSAEAWARIGADIRGPTVRLNRWLRDSGAVRRALADE